MSRVPLNQGVVRGIAPLYYLLQIVKLNQRPYAISIVIPSNVWHAVQPFLLEPFMRRWSNDVAEKWVGPNMTVHAKWGVGGTITSMRDGGVSTVEFRIGLPQGSGGYPDLWETYQSLAILLNCIHWVINRSKYELESLHLRQSGQATQLMLPMLSPTGMTVHLSPMILNWLTRVESESPGTLPVELMQKRMQEIRMHLAADKYGPTYGIRPRVDLLTPDAVSGLHFKGSNVHLLPRKVRTSSDQGISLRNRDYNPRLVQDPERVMIVNILFLCGLIEIVHIAIQNHIFASREKVPADSPLLVST